MAHLGEQAITAERQHDHVERLEDGGDLGAMNDSEIAAALGRLVDRIFVERHWNAKLIREAASRLSKAA